MPGRPKAETVKVCLLCGSAFPTLKDFVSHMPECVTGNRIDSVTLPVDVSDGPILKKALDDISQIPSKGGK